MAKFKNIRESKIVDGKHLQHSKSFQNELNKVTGIKKFEPIRLWDEVWKVGKFKNQKVSNTPLTYLKWAYENMNLNSTSKNLLKKYIEKKEI